MSDLRAELEAYIAGAKAGVELLGIGLQPDDLKGTLKSFGKTKDADGCAQAYLAGLVDGANADKPTTATAPVANGHDEVEWPPKGPAGRPPAWAKELGSDASDVDEEGLAPGA